jgi:hypothetical protein
MFWKKREERSFLDGARIGCALRGTDVEIEECLACSKLERIVEDDPWYIVCTARHDSARIAQVVY